MFLANDPVVQLCIGTSTKTLLFYRDTTMAWSAQLNVVPIALMLSSFRLVHFNDLCRSFIVQLS